MSVELTIKGDVEVLHLDPGDKIIVTLETDLGEHSADVIVEMKAKLEEVFPGHEVLILGAGLRLSRMVPT